MESFFAAPEFIYPGERAIVQEVEQFAEEIEHVTQICLSQCIAAPQWNHSRKTPIPRSRLNRQWRYAKGAAGR
jgi:hypothetical protein